MANFDKALNELPSSAGFDAFEHKTVDDLCWICLRELDLVAEGEYWQPLAERKRLLKFIVKHGYHADEARRIYKKTLSITAEDCYINDY